MSRFGAGRASYRGGRPVKCNVRMVPATSSEAREVERDWDYVFPEKGFCHECEAMIDEDAGRLHRPTCKVEPAERKRPA